MTDAEPRLILSSAGSAWKNIAVEQWQYPPLEAPERLVESCEIVISLSGTSLLEWHSGRRWRQAAIAPGACCFAPAGVRLQKRWLAPAEALILSLAPSLIARAAEEMRCPRPVELVERHGVEDPQMYAIALALRAELSGSPSGRLFTDSLAMALAARLLSSYGASPPTANAGAGGLSPTELRRAIEYVQDNLTLDTSLESIAVAVGISPTRLKTLFKQSTGWSPYQYVLQQRVECTQNLLRRGDLTPGQVALRVGFYDQSHLNRHFKRIVGLTPKEFQRQI